MKSMKERIQFIDYIKSVSQVKINKTFQRKIVNIFLLINLTYVLGNQKNRLIETVLLITLIICFGLEIRK